MRNALHEDTFYDYFKPRRHAEAAHDIWGGLGLETFGSDYQIVRGHEQFFVWTVIDGDTGNDQWIVPGMCHVNRICYLLTEIPHNWADIQFRVPSRLTSLTSLGLKRQSSQLRRYMNAQRVSN